MICGRLSIFSLIIALFACSETEPQTEKIQETLSIGIVERIYSKILEEEREIWVHVPESFYGMNRQVESYPVVYLIDGEIHFKSTVGMLDQFSNAANANDLTPAMITVGIRNTNRTRDLTPMPAVIGKDSSTLSNTGGANKLLAFIEMELIPFIDSKYPTNEHRTLIGHSFGGLFTFYSLINKPRLFTNYLIIDPSMWYNEESFSKQILRSLAELNFQKQSLYLAMANNKMPWMELTEVKNDTTEIINQMASLMRFLDSIKNLPVDGLTISTRYYPNENHGQIPLLATYDGLRFFYSDYPFPKMLEYYYPGSEQSKKDIAAEIEHHYQMLSDRLGYRVLPQESYINAYAYGLLSFEKPEVAKKLFELNIKNYPESANTYAAMGNFYFRQQDTVNAIINYEQALVLEEMTYVRKRLNDLKASKEL